MTTYDKNIYSDKERLKMLREALEAEANAKPWQVLNLDGVTWCDETNPMWHLARYIKIGAIVRAKPPVKTQSELDIEAYLKWRGENDSSGEALMLRVWQAALAYARAQEHNP
jgi:hypothetical protein